MHRGLIMAATLAVAGAAHSRFDESPSDGPRATMDIRATQVVDSARIILSEVQFDPAADATAFVELLNVGERPIELSSLVLRIDSIDLPLPRLATPVTPGTRVVILFDGDATVEDNVVHTASGFGLRAEGGTVSVRRNDDQVLDEFAWGDAPDAFVPTIGGLARRQLERGSSFGRPPGADRSGDRSAWVVYAPDQVTPGQPNPLPPVAQLLPIDGAILEETSVDLGWYPVPGAVRYRVQLARDSGFAQTVLDQTVTEPAVSTGQLAPGEYWWRVQAMPAEGQAAPWTLPYRIELGSAGGGDANDADGGSFGPYARGDGGSDGGSTITGVVLNVPLISQHKDTRMLHLEALQEGRRRTSSLTPRMPHAWDRDHGRLDQNDPADQWNCTLASVAMINHFHRGDLSQDRIGYEVWSRNVATYQAAVVNPAVAALVTRLLAGPADPQEFVEAQPGPERDLHYGEGMPWGRLVAAGLFALGSLPGANSGDLPPHGTLTKDSVWNAVTAEIDAGRPVLAFIPGHAIVIRGYELRGNRRLLHINDPWAGRYAFDLDAAVSGPGRTGLQGIWTYPNVRARSQEAEVSADTDGDGVVDFDETQRFRTSPTNRDTDGDGVEDKWDIASGVYEVEFGLGYAFAPGPNSRGRDYDFDGQPTELDPDSDNGGCNDGEEDLNGDGERAGAETGNFNPTDDMCGTLQGNISYLIEAINTDPDQLVREIHDQGVILVKLKPEAPGSPSYVDAGSTYSYQGYARLEIVVGPNCIMWGREMARAAGSFSQGSAEIGATRGDDGTLAMGAMADVPSQTSTGGCGGSGASIGERTMNFPDCTGQLPAAGAAAPAQRTYRFDCTTKPNLGPGWTVTAFYARGFVRVN